MSSRAEILKNVKANRASPMELPSMEQTWQTFDDPLAHFRQVLTGIGGTSQVVSNRAAGDAWLAERDYYSAADSTDSGATISMVEGIGRSTLELDQLETPHELSGLDWAVLPGEFAVAENGAIWITDRQARHRAVYYLCEHLVLVVSKNQVLHNMHQAYEQIAGWGTDDHPHFGAFVAGPSKTADIEQSLVIGAQGPRSLDILLVEEL